MPDTSGYGYDIRDDDALVGDDNSSVSSLGSASTLVSEGANPGRRLPNIRPHIDHRVDVVIIGSGITAVGVALSILPLMASRGMAPDVFVLEAMGLCHEGATQHDALMSFLPCRVFRPDGGLLPEKVLDFQVKNAEAVKELESKYLGAGAREFEMEELYDNDEDLEFGKRTQRPLDELYPQYGATILEGDEVPHYGPLRARGARTNTARLIRLHKLVTSIWADLRTQYANLRISTNTCVRHIALTTGSSHPYIVTSSWGSIRARHVVHATASSAPRLLPEIGLTAGWKHRLLLRPGARFPNREGKHIWALHLESHPFTVIRLPGGNDEIDELLIDWEWVSGRDHGEMLSTVDQIYSYMESVFGPEWKDAEIMGQNRSSTIGITGDSLPFVGRIPQDYTNRGVSSSEQAAVEAPFSDDGGLATPGEWISAGYNGQETAFALLSGHAVGIQIAGMENEELEMVPGRPGGRLNDWFPKEELSLDDDRMMRANLGSLG
ncbi:hypothetical protein MHUMG1_03499 [Metarhizium humberi]|uniref:FAD dependent oxidoreductase domain-containing protein n=1 Tax=Metarhizium humberi TaxID=2596975 RepID=A0A9P8MDA9_9HYPO|nr:hypothetical protein MHUMG1_03499 [Metarhizium humberi]